MPKTKPRYTGKKCRHCKKATVSRPRGLCWVCYYTPGVKDLYAPQCKTEPNEQTEEELNAIIREQLKPENLPKWWSTDVKRQADKVEREKIEGYHRKIRVDVTSSVGLLQRQAL